MINSFCSVWPSTYVFIGLPKETNFGGQAGQLIKLSGLSSEASRRASAGAAGGEGGEPASTEGFKK